MSGSSDKKSYQDTKLTRHLTINTRHLSLVTTYITPMTLNKIITTLSANAALAAKVNAVYNSVPPDAKFPYIVVDNIVASGQYARTNFISYAKVTIKIFSSSRNSDEVEEIQKLVKQILSGNDMWEEGCAVMRHGLAWVGSSVFNIILYEDNAYSGNCFLIKIGNNAAIETFSVIGGLLNASIKLENKIIDCSNLSSGKWRALQSGAGITWVSISGNGFFTNSQAEQTLRSLAFSGNSNNYEIILGGDEKICGSFIVASYSMAGNVNELGQVRVGLESGGQVSGIRF